jgi:hypothetical protein
MTIPPDVCKGVQGVLNALKPAGFRSINDFLLEYYLSDNEAIVELAQRLLQYRSNRHDRFFPRRLLPAIEARCSGDAATQFRVAMTKRVGEYVKGESNSAIRQPSLHLDLNDHRLADETSLFDSLYSTYQAILPCLCLLLSILLTASNKYERDRKVEKVGKAETAARVRLRSTK